MSTSPAEITSFQKDWAKTLAYANANGIPTKAYLPVYQADSASLLTNGTPKYSQAERILAVSSSAGMAPVSSVPQDNPSPTAVFSNVRNNLMDIFTGLNPFRMIPNIWDTVTNTVEHPADAILKPLQEQIAINTTAPGSAAHQQALKEFSDSVLGHNSPYAFVPGVYDAAYAYQGKPGLKHLAANPITAALDVVPFGKLISKVGAHTATGAIIANRLGIAPEELGKLTPGQIAFRLGKTIPTKVLKEQANPVTGEIAMTPMSVGDRWNSFRNHWGAGTQQAELARAASMEDIRRTSEAEALLSPGIEALGTLLRDTPELATQAVNYLKTEYLQTDFRTVSQIVTDPRFTELQGRFIQSAIDVQRHMDNVKLDARELIEVNTPYGVEKYLAGEHTRSDAVLISQQKMEDSYNALTQGAENFDAVLQQSDAIDYLVGQQIPRLSQLTQTVYDHIKGSIGDPQIAGSPIADKLRETLPTAQRWDRTRTPTGDRKTLQTFLGLDSGTLLTVRRGAEDVEPFTGSRKLWTEPEQEAWDDARKTLEKNAASGETVTRAAIKKQAIDRLKILGQATETTVHGPIPANAAKLLQDVAGPHGLAAQAIDAYNNQRWPELQQVTSALHSKLSRKSLNSPTRSPLLMQFQSDMEALYKYSQQRQKISAQLISMYYGEKFKVDPETGEMVRGGRGGLIQSGKYSKRNSIQMLMTRYEKHNKDFHTAALMHPPAIWDNLFQQEYTRLWIEHEAGKQVADSAIEHLREQGYTSDQLKDLRDDPQTLRELVLMASKSSLANPMWEDITRGEDAEIARDAYKNIGDMRAAGITPFYSTTLTSFDRIGQSRDPLYNVSIGKERVSKPGSLREKSGQISARADTNTVHNFAAAMTKEVTEYLRTQGEIAFQMEHVQPFLYSREQMFRHFTSYYADKIRELGIGADAGKVMNLFQQIMEERGFIGYDPKSIFSTVAPRFDNNEYFIDKDIEKGLRQTFRGYDNPFVRTADKATGIFRESILGYSPRYTMHIAIGGTMLVLYRANPSMALHLKNAARIAWTKALPDDIKAQYQLTDKNIHDIERHNSTQEGAAETTLKHAMGYSAGQYVIQEWIAKLFGKEAADLKHPDFYHNLIHVLPSLNYRFTRFVTNMQRATVFLDGVERAHKDGYFFDDVVKSDGTVSREKIPMTPDAAIHQGMQAADKVMGDVLAMTPIEREFLTRLMPFWSWTKHILKYVMTYPADHPYRAMFLSQQSRIIQQQNGTGLPIRAELLFFFGGTSPTGDQRAFDVRASNPLRDTGNYLTMGGWLSALNPVLTAPLTYINPNATFGTNVLYPKVQYDELYGTNESVPTGSFWNATEQIVPEVTAADAALNLSGQYNYLHTTGQRNALADKVFSGLNVSFLHEQSLNLREIAATQEIDRYKMAEAASKAAWTSGDFSQLNGYNTVPDPRNSQYEITPANLEKIYRAYQVQAGNTGLPPAAIATSPRNPGY